MVALLAGVFFLSATVVGYISFRGHTVEVPNVIGKSEEEAEEELLDQGLRIKVTGKAYNEKISVSAVADQAPAAGAIVKSGQIVRVSVSLGPAPNQAQK
jgi:beta-lactam-binding protein with PASTA domain